MTGAFDAPVQATVAASALHILASTERHTVIFDIHHILIRYEGFGIQGRGEGGLIWRMTGS
jgi:hypothetical protein